MWRGNWLNGQEFWQTVPRSEENYTSFNSYISYFSLDPNFFNKNVLVNRLLGLFVYFLVWSVHGAISSMACLLSYFSTTKQLLYTKSVPHDDSFWQTIQLLRNIHTIKKSISFLNKLWVSALRQVLTRASGWQKYAVRNNLCKMQASRTLSPCTEFTGMTCSCKRKR